MSTGESAADRAPGLDADTLDDALRRAQEHLRGRQAPEGWWKGELATNVTMDAEDLLLRQFLGILRPDQLDAAARWIRSQQRDDGTWANFYGGPGDLSTTIEAYAALRLAGDTTDADHMARAREFVLASGGIEASRVFTRIWLALFGEWPWDELPAMPPELDHAPGMVSVEHLRLGLLGAPDDCAADDRLDPAPGAPAAVPPDRAADGLAACGGAAEPRRAGAQRARCRPEGLPPAGGHPGAPGGACAEAQSGSSRARRPTAGGAASSHPGSTRSWRCTCWATRSSTPCWRQASPASKGSSCTKTPLTGPIRRLEACQSPVWDTCLAVIALVDAGIAPDDPALVARAGGCSTKRSRSPATGRCGGPGSRPRAGRSSSPTTSTPTSTTPPR